MHYNLTKILLYLPQIHICCSYMLFFFICYIHHVIVQLKFKALTWFNLRARYFLLTAHFQSVQRYLHSNIILSLSSNFSVRFMLQQSCMAVWRRILEETVNKAYEYSQMFPLNINLM